MDWVKRLLGTAATEPADDTPHFIYVKLPEALDPVERHARYEDPLDAELRLAGLGQVSGGGTALSEPDEEGERSIEYCGVDVDTADLAGARAVLREHLPDLGCQPGTQLEYVEHGIDLRDVYDGERWALGIDGPLVQPDD